MIIIIIIIIIWNKKFLCSYILGPYDIVWFVFKKFLSWYSFFEFIQRHVNVVNMTYNNPRNVQICT
jgi:hypothetical protein